MLNCSEYDQKFLLKPVHCGLFGIQEDYEERVLSLDDLLVKSDVSTFFFRTSGDSMEPTIFKGDVLVVDTSIKPTHGRIVVCEYQGERICKRLFLGRPIKLISDNLKHQVIQVDDQHDLVIFGVVVGIARKL